MGECYEGNDIDILSTRSSKLRHTMQLLREVSVYDASYLIVCVCLYVHSHWKDRIGFYGNFKRFKFAFLFFYFFSVFYKFFHTK